MNGRRMLLITLGLTALFVLGGVLNSLAEVKPEIDRIEPFICKGRVEVQFESDVDLNRIDNKGGSLSLGISSLDLTLERHAVNDARPLFPWRQGQKAMVGSDDMSRYFILEIPDESDVLALVDDLQKSPYIRSASPVWALPVAALANDDYRSSQWALNKIQANNAWDIQTGTDTCIAAVIDIGVLYNHEDLKANIWVNPAEDIDHDEIVWDEDDFDSVDSPDDPNILIDDLIGYDFFNGFGGGMDCYAGEDCSTPDNDPKDFDGHGTHIAGIIAGVTNNEIGISGLSGGWVGDTLWDGTPLHNFATKIMCLRAGALAEDEIGYLPTDYLSQAMDYAILMGATHINCSWGGGGLSGQMSVITAMRNAMDNDIFVAHAAGNDDANNPDYYDAGTYSTWNGHKLVLSVASSNHQDLRSDFSNYGLWVDVTAPGGGGGGVNNILSTYSIEYSPAYVYIQGTSMSCPFTVGLACLIKSHMPHLHEHQIDSVIINTADPMPNEPYWIGEQLGSGRINAQAALEDFAEADFEVTSVNVGSAPFSVDFEDTSPNLPSSWDWDFGDGGSAETQDASNVYTEWGLYSPSLTITEPRGTHTRVKKNLVMITADTIRMPSIPTMGNDTDIVMPVYLDNKFLATEISFPFDISVGKQYCNFDSFSVAGLRTEYFEDITIPNQDPTWRNAYRINMRPNLSTGSDYLQPDTGAILNLWFHISSFAPQGIISIDSTNFSGKALEVKSLYYNYTPDYIPGLILVDIPNCCLFYGIPGDADKSGTVNLTDILNAISYVYVDPISEPEAADGCNALYDVNGDGTSVENPTVNLTDILNMISHVYVEPTGEPVLCCPPGCQLP